MGARTGQQYLDRLKANSPEVWVGSDRITDVTEHPATRGAAHQIARLYDIQHEPAQREDMLFPSPDTGDMVGTQFLVPRSRGDLARRRRAHKVWSDATLGLMGRTTDFIGAMLTAWYINADFFGEHADRVRTYFEHVRENDLFLTHALADPPVDRSQPPSRQPDPYTYLGVERETEEGLIVSGAKMLATAAPYSDEILVWPFSVRRSEPSETPYAIAFAIPSNTAGLRFISRETFSEHNSFDHPLASRFDEMDAVAVFDQVLVPWDRVFINQDHERVNRIWEIQSNAFTGVQTSTRLLSKLQFVAGLAKRATAMVNTDQFPQVRDMMGEMTTYIELTKAAVLASEASAEAREDGIFIPDVAPLFAVRNSGNRWYPRMREMLQLMLAGGLLYQPGDVSAFDSPIAKDLAKFYRGPEVSAVDRIAMYKVAADLAVGGFGGRHELYERFYAGDPMFLRINTQFMMYDWAEPLRLIDGLLAQTKLPAGAGSNPASNGAVPAGVAEATP
ncbi:MAG: hpaB [Conexibacter sp.]|nr:hpaB [Conexibacter sp.]